MNWNVEALANTAGLSDPRKMFEPYEPGDPLVLSWSGQVEATTANDAAETTWMLLNRDDRPNGKDAPSLRVGDVVLVETPDGTGAFAVDHIGFTNCPVPLPEDVVRDRTYRELADSVR